MYEKYHGAVNGSMGLKLAVQEPAGPGKEAWEWYDRHPESYLGMDGSGSVGCVNGGWATSCLGKASQKPMGINMYGILALNYLRFTPGIGK